MGWRASRDSDMAAPWFGVAASTATLLGCIGRAGAANPGLAPRAAPISSGDGGRPEEQTKACDPRPHGGLHSDPPAEGRSIPAGGELLAHVLASSADHDLVSVPDGWAVTGSMSPLPPALSPGLVEAWNSAFAELVVAPSPSLGSSPLAFAVTRAIRGSLLVARERRTRSDTGVDRTIATPPPWWRRPARARPGCWASRRQTRPGARRLGSRAGGSSSGSSRAPAER